MDLLNKSIQEIKKPNKEIYHKALERLANQARPSGSLGLLEYVSAKLAGIKKTIDVKLNHKIIVTCAGDHGVVEEGISVFPQEVTSQMVYNFVNKGASINILAKHVNAKVVVADFGVKHDFKPDLPIFHKKVAKGTKNFTKSPAMSKAETVKAIQGGIEIINELVNQGPIDILGTGDMGIGNTTPSTAIIAAFSGIKVENLTGRGTGIDDNMFENKINIIKKGLYIHKPNPGNPIDVLSKVGGFEIGGLAGLVIGAASKGIPVVCDGLISTAGALIACELAPLAKEYLFASHRSVEIGHKFMHERLNITPLLDLKFRLGEGTGAAVAMELIDIATRILADIKTFEEVAIVNVQKK